MKYAVPVSGGQLSPHFGHCEQFALFEVDAGQKQIVHKEMLDAPPHEPGLLPRWLADQGVDLVIAGGMGGRALGLFQQNGIQVVIGAGETDPERAVLDHLNGVLASGDNVCDH